MAGDGGVTLIVEPCCTEIFMSGWSGVLNLDRLHLTHASADGSRPPTASVRACSNDTSLASFARYLRGTIFCISQAACSSNIIHTPLEMGKKPYVRTEYLLVRAMFFSVEK